MAERSGIASQVMAKAETTYGTAVTPDVSIPFVSEGLGTDPNNRVESAAIVAGRHVLMSGQWAEGNRMVGGPLALELPTNSAIARLWLEQMMGAVSGTGPYTYTPGSLVGKSTTIQKGVPGVDGTVRPFTFAGCKVASWEIAWAAGQIVTFGLDFIAQSMVTATALATASFASGAEIPFVFAGATASIDGSAVKVKQGTLKGDNKIERRMFGGTRQTDEPLQTELNEYTGSLQLEFVDLTQASHFIDGDEAPVVVTFAGVGSSSMVLTYNARFDGETPKVTGRKIVEQPLPIKAVGATTDASALTIVYTAPS